MSMQGQLPHLGTRHDHTRPVPSLVQSGSDPQAGDGARVADEGHHRLERAQRSTAPVLRDVAEEAMLNLVPFARPRWKVRDMDRQLQIVGEALQASLPGAATIPIA